MPEAESSAGTAVVEKNFTFTVPKGGTLKISEANQPLAPLSSRKPLSRLTLSAAARCLWQRFGKSWKSQAQNL